jgi:4-hydroxy 2-oxovalerate aldolase
MDGVIYHGNRILEGVFEFVEWLKAEDKHYLFLTNSKRYVQLATQINRLGNNIQIVATSNVTKSTDSFDYMLDYESLIDRDAVFMDNSFIMLLKVLIKLGVKDVALAGFDGYSHDRETNYYSTKMEYQFAKQKGEEINKYVNKMLESFRKDIHINFITDTVYQA